MADRIALQWREGGVGAALLEVAAAPVSFVRCPGVFRARSAVELHAAPALLMAAPVLLGI